MDIYQLFNSSIQFKASRISPKLLSLGDDNTIKINLENQSQKSFNLSIIDELPKQLQIRDLLIQLEMKPSESKVVNYTIHPTDRGLYTFGDIHLFFKTYLGLIQRRITIPAKEQIPVYPSIIQMKNYDLKTIEQISKYFGIKKIRKLGHNYEFEQIKNYVIGDDYRSLNWKATSRRGELMVNQYQDEKSQPIYSILDLGRSMYTPFYNLSLLDYSINTSLSLANVSLQKQDKAGIITFAKQIQTFLKAESKPLQLKKTLEILYNAQITEEEPNYELLYQSIRNSIKSRSLIFLFTNFESSYSLERVIPILKRINKLHLLVVVFFENEELSEYAFSKVSNLEDIYTKTIAHQFLSDKKKMVITLQKFAIQAILTKPKDLTINTINKYLELKARGLI